MTPAKHNELWAHIQAYAALGDWPQTFLDRSEIERVILEIEAEARAEGRREANTTNNEESKRG